MFGWTALFYAAAMNHDQVVLLLLEYGSDIHHRNNFGENSTKRVMTCKPFLCHIIKK